MPQVNKLLTIEEAKIIDRAEQYEQQILNDPFPAPHEIEEDIYAAV